MPKTKAQLAAEAQVLEAQQATIVANDTTASVVVHQDEPITNIDMVTPNECDFVGIVSASRTIVQPETNNSGSVVKQGLVLLTIRSGLRKVKVTIGTAFLLSVDAFKDGINDKAVEIEYEECIKNVTTYADKDGEIKLHTFTGNRIVTIEPLSDSAYIDHRLASEKQANINLITSASGNASALVDYLRG